MTSISTLLVNAIALVALLAYFAFVGVLVRAFARATIEAIGEFRQATTFGTRVDYGFQGFVGFGCATGISVCALYGPITALF